VDVGGRTSAGGIKGDVVHTIIVAAGRSWLTSRLRKTARGKVSRGGSEGQTPVRNFGGERNRKNRPISISSGGTDGSGVKGERKSGKGLNA